MKIQKGIQRLKLACILSFLCVGATLFAQQQDSVKVKTESKKEGGDRNVMLNASSVSSPREIPIGLPPNGLDIAIMQDGVPVVMAWWPNLPTIHWRADASLSSLGLNSYAETAIAGGHIGFGVNSDSQLGGKYFKGKVNLLLNHYGSYQVDMNINGPIAKGWSYSASAFLYDNPGTFKLGYGDAIEHTKMFKLALTKTFDKNKGNLSFIYKHSELKDEGSNGNSVTPFRYNGDGSITTLPGLPLGTVSTVQKEGLIKYTDVLTGESKTANYRDDNIALSRADEYTGLLNYKFDNGMKLRMTAKYQTTAINFALVMPLSVTENVPYTQGFSYYSSGLPFTGNMEQVLGVLCSGNDKNLFFTAELKQRLENHNLRLGFNEWNTNTTWGASSSMYFQELAAQPQLLTNPYIGGTFIYQNAGYVQAFKGTENRLALYFTDNWDITKRWNLNYGVRAENQKINVDNLPYNLYPGFHVGGTSPYPGVGTINWVNNDKNSFNLTLNASTSYSLTNAFGVLADAGYTQLRNGIGQYEFQVNPAKDMTPVTMGRVGLYYNHKLLSVVSTLNYIQKDNFYETRTMSNPSDMTVAIPVACNYNARTVGWTTDIVAKPTKNFNLHFLLTLQDPQYADFKFTAFGNDYDFSGKTVIGVSKVYMEIDPTYNITKDLSLWASARYFGKQTANLSNVLYFNGHWETFGGVRYTLNKNVNFGLTVVNFLNQTGASGQISGSDLITDASKVKGAIVMGSYIRPFTVEFKTAINF